MLLCKGLRWTPPEGHGNQERANYTFWPAYLPTSLQCVTYLDMPRTIFIWSQIPVGREYFLSPQPVDILQPGSHLEYPLAKIVSFTEHRDTIRRGGVVSTIKYVHASCS